MYIFTIEACSIGLSREESADRAAGVVLVVVILGGVEASVACLGGINIPVLGIEICSNLESPMDGLFGLST